MLCRVYVGGCVEWQQVACPAAVKIGAYGDAMFASIAGVASVLRLKVLQDVTLGAGGAGVLSRTPSSAVGVRLSFAFATSQGW